MIGKQVKHCTGKFTFLKAIHLPVLFENVFLLYTKLKKTLYQHAIHNTVKSLYSVGN